MRDLNKKFIVPSEDLLKSGQKLQNIEVPSNAKNNTLWKNVIKFQFIYSCCGLILGIACIVGGILLFINGVSGSTNWVADFIGAKSNISDASPGVVLFVIGLFFVWITRFKIKVIK